MPLMFIATSPAPPHIKGGRLRALGTSGAKGLPVLPDVRPIADTLAGFDHTDWCGMLAPAGTPHAIVAKLNRKINNALAAADVRERMASMGTEPVGNTIQEFDARIKSEIAKWAKVFARGANPWPSPALCRAEKRSAFRRMVECKFMRRMAAFALSALQGLQIISHPIRHR